MNRSMQNYNALTFNTTPFCFWRATQVQCNSVLSLKGHTSSIQLCLVSQGPHKSNMTPSCLSKATQDQNYLSKVEQYCTAYSINWKLGHLNGDKKASVQVLLATISNKASYKQATLFLEKSFLLSLDSSFIPRPLTYAPFRDCRFVWGLFSLKWRETMGKNYYGDEPFL